MSFLHCISSFGGIIKICKIQPPDFFYLLLFLLAFTSADIIFHKFLKLHSAYLRNRFLSQIFDELITNFH